MAERRQSRGRGLEGNLLIPVLRDVLSWRTNATWMLKSESKETGNPLSVIPKYTVNTMLDWQVNDALSANVNWTLYGRQKPRQYAEIRNETGTLATTEVGAYSIVWYWYSVSAKPGYSP